ncbi:MAG: hypothetical protein IPM96_19435 [Ignavibacteria bacterium]|nr:hypothetical protein [Ignavibacteria bacterium]
MADENEKLNSTLNKKTKEFILKDYIQLVLKYKKLLITSTLIVGLIVTILMFFVVDPIYLSSAKVKSAGGSGLSSFLGVSGLPDLGGLEALGGGSGSKELALYEEILLSRRCIEETIIKFNLMEVYDIKYMEDAIKAFRLDIMLLTANKKANTLSIDVFDKDKQRAKEIAEYLIFQLNKIYSEMSALNAKNNKEFIEQRYDSAKIELKIAEDSLQGYQDIYGLSPEIQAEVASKTSLQLEATIKSEEIKLELMRKILTDNQPEIKEQEEKLVLLNNQLNEIKYSEDGNSSLQLKGLPTVIINFLRLKRDLEIKNRILTTIIPIYEQAKFEQKRETPTVIILDYPYLPEKKTKPKRLITILFSMVAFLFFITTTLTLYELYYKKLISLFRNV